MAKDFSNKKGRVDSGNSNERGPKESAKPTTGFEDAPTSETKFGEPGPGVGNTRRGIR